MLLYPKKTIYGKNYSRKKITVNQKQPDSFAFGDFSVVAKESGRVTQKQLEYLKRFLQRKLKKESKI
jgi:ribosomal protein L16/L10AE